MTSYSNFLHRLLRSAAEVLLMLPLLLAAALPASGQDSEPGMAIFGVDSEAFPTVAVSLAVRSPGQPVQGLTAGDIQIFEDGRQLPEAAVVTVEPELLQELYLVLALDVSMPKEDLDQVKSAARGAVLDQLGPKDRLALLRFGDESGQVRNFTNNTDQLLAAVDGLAAGGEATALHQTLIQAAELMRAGAAGRRAAVLVVTDRHDNAGRFSISQVEQEMQQAQAPFYIIGFGDRVQDENQDKELAGASGGLYLAVPGAADLQPALQKVVAGLRQGYRLTFLSGLKADNKTHRLAVTINGQGRAEAEFVALPGEIEMALPGVAGKLFPKGWIDLSAEVNAPAPVVSVTYAINGLPPQQITTAPYVYRWDATTIQPGAYTLTVSAIDSAGNEGRAEFPIHLVAPPQITAHDLPAEIQRGAPLIVDASPSAEAALAQVELWLDGQERLAGGDTPPYRFEVASRDIPAGPHVLTLRAIDKLGQTGETDLDITFTPHPDELSRLERLGRRLGFRDHALFLSWLSFTINALILTTALGLGILVTITTYIEMRWIDRMQRLKCRKRYELDIANTGNISSGYQLWAEDPAGRLQFEFARRGASLPYGSMRQASQAAAPPYSPPAVVEPVAAAATPAPVASNGQPARPATKGSQTGKRATGLAREMVGMLRLLGRLLGPAGGLFNGLANRLSAGQRTVQSAGRLPGQVTRHRGRLQRQVNQGTPPPAAAPSPGDGGAAPGSGGVAPPASLSPGIGKSPHRPASPGPGARRRASRFYTAAEPAETPEIGVDQTLTIDLWITPLDPYRRQEYPFTLYSAASQMRTQTLLRREAIARITGIPWLRRYPPRVVVGLLMLLLLAGLGYMAFWALSLNILGLLAL